MAKGRVEDWVGTPVVLNAVGKSVEGLIKYGVRLPMRPGITPLHECTLGSREKVEGLEPGYWFVNPDQDIKVRLSSCRVCEDKISGRGYDGVLVRYTITPKK